MTLTNTKTVTISMPHSRMSNETNWSPHYTVVCLAGCGIINQVPRTYVKIAAARHYYHFHPDVEEADLAENQHWQAYLAPVRCDTCGEAIEVPYWEHTATPPIDLGTVVDHDGKWLLCHTCHTFWATADTEGWRAHRTAVLTEQSPYYLTYPQIFNAANGDVFAAMALMLDQFDEGHRVTSPPAAGLP